MLVPETPPWAAPRPLLRGIDHAGSSGDLFLVARQYLTSLGSDCVMAQLSLAVDEEVGRIGVQTGFITDIGGGRENQDDGFIWSNSDAQLVVIGVLDGHGREVGRTAAVAAKNCLLKLLESDYSKLLQSPVDFLIYAHQRAHESIKQSFAAEFERQGYQVQAAGEGFLLKRRTPMDNWSCVHGGAACTLIALVGSSLYIANVGDSTALLCAPKPILSPSTLQFERDAAIDDPSAAVQSLQSRQEASRLLVLTAEHSPESTSEFVRLRTYRHRDGDPSQPALYVVYDSASHDKTQCAPIFDVTKPSLAASQRGR